MATPPPGGKKRKAAVEHVLPLLSRADLESLVLSAQAQLPGLAEQALALAPQVTAARGAAPARRAALGTAPRAERGPTWRVAPASARARTRVR